MSVSVGWVLHDPPGTWGDLLPVFGGELGIGLWFPCVYKSVALSVCASLWMPGSACSYKCCPLVVESSSLQFSSVQFSSVAQSCPTLCDPMNCSTPGLPVHHQPPEVTQTHVHRVRDAIQPSHFSSFPQSLPASESFPMSQLFT